MSANCQDFNPWANNVPTNATANLVVKNNSGLSSGLMNSNQAMANNQGAFNAWEPNRYQAPIANNNNMAPYNPWQAPNQPQGFTHAQTQAQAQAQTQVHAQAQAQAQSFTQATAQNHGQSQNMGFTQGQGQAKGQNQNLGIPAFQGAAMSSRAGQFYNGGHNQNGGYNQSNQQPYGLYAAQDRVNQCSSATQAFSNSSTHNARANDYAYTQAPAPMMNQGLSPRPNMAMATGQVYSQAQAQAQAQGHGQGQSNSQGPNQSSNKSFSYGQAMSQGQSVSRSLAMGQELAVGQSQGLGQSGQCQANGYGGGANYNNGSTVSQSDVYKGQVATANQEQVVKSDDCCGAVVDGNLALNEEASLEVMESSSDKEHRRPLNNQGQLSNYPPCGPKTVHARHFKTNTKAANENMEGAEGKASVNTACNGNGKATKGNEIVFKHELLESTLSSSNHAHVINFGSDVKQRKIVLKDCFEEKINLEYFYLPEYDLSLSPLVPSKNKQYVFDPDNLEQILRHLQNNHGDSLFLSGPTGCGKTSLILEIASRLDWPVECITLSQTSEVADLIGHNILKKGQITFEYGPLSRAMMYGEILLLNEIDLMSAGELTALNDVLEGRALCVNANNGEVIYPHPFFRVVATANSKGLGDNSGNYLGVRKQNKAFLDRWIFFECTYPDYDLEQNLILKNFTNINPDLIKYFAVLARELRFAAGLGVSKTNKDLLIEMKNFFKDNYHDYPGNLDLLVSDNTVPKIDELLEKQTFDDGVSLSLSELDNLASLQVELNPHLSVPLSTRSLLRIIRLYLSDNQLSITDAVRHGFAARLEPKEFAFVMRMTFEIFGYVSEFDKLPRTISNVEEYLDFRKQNISKEIVERLLLSEDSLRAMFDKSAPVAANSKDNIKESDLLKPDVIEAKTTSSGAKSKTSATKSSKSKTKEAKASKAVDSQDVRNCNQLICLFTSSSIRLLKQKHLKEDQINWFQFLSFEKTEPLSSSSKGQEHNAHEVKSQDAESSSSQGQSLSAKSKPDHSLEQEKSATKSASTLSPEKSQESHEGSNNDKPQAQAMPQDLPQSQALPQELAQSKPQTEPKAAEPKAQPKGSGSGSSSMADDVRKKDKVVEEIKKFIRDTEPGLADKFIVVRG